MMGFFFNIYFMEELKTVCRNPWCKATFFYKEEDMVVVSQDTRRNNIDSVLDEVQKMPPTTCPKCNSFATELSGGIEWKTKDYEGSRFDGTPHEMRYRVTNYKL